MRSSSRQQLAAHVLFVLVTLSACVQEAPSSQVFVVLDADMPSRAAIRSVHVEVLRKPDEASDRSAISTWQPRFARTFTPGSDAPNWPLEIRLTPLRDDVSSRYVVVATASDARERVVAQTRAVSGFVRGVTLGLPMFFDSACLGKAELCDEMQTCRATADGTARCVDAYVAAIDLPEFRGSTSLIQDAADAAVEDDASISPDPDDGGSVEPPIGDPCEGRDGTSFCVGSSIRTCSGSPPALDQPCAGEDQCVERDGAAFCVCAAGAVTSTDCETAEACDVDNGCDSVTTCALIGGDPACSACPAGFRGTGLQGCIATVMGLDVANGDLLTTITPETTTYEISVSVFQRRALLTWHVPELATLEIDGVAVDLSEPWTSPVLRAGENVFDVRLGVAGHTEVRLDMRVRRQATQEAYIKADPPMVEDGFGRGVFLDGDQLLVGSPFEDRRGMTSSSVSDSGSAYIFERGPSGWAQQAYLKPAAPQADAWFGTSLTLHDDLAIVGAPQTNRGGGAYVFERIGGTWTESALLEPTSPVLGSWFGLDMVLQDDLLLITAPVTGPGRVYVFERTGGGFAQQDILQSSRNQADAQFGAAIALNGNTLAVSATYDGAGLNRGAVYAFDRGATDWTESQRLVAESTADGDEFGYSVDVHGDLIAVGAPYNDTRGFDSGAAYIFERVGGEWVEQAMLVASNGGTFYQFGASVRLIADDLIVVGSGGESSSLSGVDPDESNASALGAGALYVFGRNGDEWVQEAYLKAAFPGENDGLGAPTSFSNGTLAAGALTESGGSSGVNGDQEDNSRASSGAVYLFR